jgi:primosomal protein N' (replication factor Y)
VLADLADNRTGGVLVIVADIEGAARWAQRLAKAEPVVRLDSGVSERERARGWAALAAGRVRVAVGTRSALLAPVPPPATLALIDEHEPAHMPPGHPRIHARDVLLERARRDAARLVLTTATPSVEMWWRASSGRARRVAADAGPWPAVTIADTRGILRREPLTPELARALRETVAHGGRAFLAVSRYASALACEECGVVARCAACGLALAYARAARRLTCRVCRADAPPPETCPECRGRRLSAFGWGVERVEQAVQRRLPSAHIARYEPDGRGRRAHGERSAVARADVVIGTRGALRLFGPASLALAGFVSPDHLLRMPDFRAGERLLAFLWAAAERVGAGGQLVVQSQHPSHHALAAVAGQAMDRFYEPELSFRAELGYPPFRRLALVTLRRRRPDDAQLGALLGTTLGGVPDVTVYPASPMTRSRGERIVVKGGDDLSDVLADAIRTIERASGRDSRGIMDVEVDPVEWPS